MPAPPRELMARATRFRVEATMVVELERGPEPQPADIERIVKHQLEHEQLHLSVDNDDGSFGGSRVEVVNVRLTARGIK